MLNLSLLTSDMWAVIIRIFAYHEKVRELFISVIAIIFIEIKSYNHDQMCNHDYECVNCHFR